MGSNTLGQQPGLWKLDAIHTQKEGKAFLPASMCANLPCRQGKLAYGKNTWKIKMPAFQGVKEIDNN